MVDQTNNEVFAWSIRGFADVMAKYRSLQGVVNAVTNDMQRLSGVQRLLTAPTRFIASGAGIVDRFSPYFTTGIGPGGGISQRARIWGWGRNAGGLMPGAGGAGIGIGGGVNTAVASGASGVHWWQKSLGSLSGSMNNLGTTLTKVLFGAFATIYTIKRLLSPLERLVKGIYRLGETILKQTDFWYRERISLSEFFGKERSGKILEYAWEKASVSLGQADEFLDLIRGLSAAVPEFQKKLTGNWDDAKKSMDRLIHTAQAMVTVYPQYTLEHAARAIQQVAAGQWHVMTRTFKTPRAIVEQQLGIKIDKGMQAVDALNKYFGQKISKEAINKIGAAFGEQLKNATRRFGIWFPYQIGIKGFFQTVSNDLLELNTKTNEMLAAKKFDARFQEISNAFKRMWQDLVSGMQSLVDGVDVASDDIETIVMKMIGNLEKSIPVAIRSIGMKVSQMLEKDFPILGRLLDLLSAGGTVGKSMFGFSKRAFLEAPSELLAGENVGDIAKRNMRAYGGAFKGILNAFGGYFANRKHPGRYFGDIVEMASASQRSPEYGARSWSTKYGFGPKDIQDIRQDEMARRSLEFFSPKTALDLAHKNSKAQEDMANNLQLIADRTGRLVDIAGEGKRKDRNGFDPNQEIN